MECHEALEILDADSAGAWDGEPAVADEAQRHLSHCEHCQSVWPQRDDWNRKLAVSMQSVTVPPHVYERLREFVPPASTVATAPVRRISRRWFWGAILTTSAAVVLAVYWPAAQPLLRLDDLRSAIDVDVEALPKFTGRFELRLPHEWQPFFQLDQSYVHGFPMAGQVQAGRVALVPFQFTSRRGVAPLRGRLLILTRRQLHSADVPTDSFSTAEVGYLTSNVGSGMWLVWAEGDYVYACLIPDGPVPLEQFRKTLSASPPLS